MIPLPEESSLSRKLRLPFTLAAALLALAVLACASDTPSTETRRVRLLLDWAWEPYHAAFLLARERGFYREAGLEVEIEQGRGSASTAMVVGQGAYDVAHLNVTNAAQAIANGVPLQVIALYQHRSAAALIGVRGRVELTGPASLEGLRIGSTPGGSDGLSLEILTKLNGLDRGELDVVSLDSSTKRAMLLSGGVDVVSGDSHAYAAIVRGSGQEPVVLLLSDLGVPLLGFGFAANRGFLEREPEAVESFLAATRRGFQVAAQDPEAACRWMQGEVLLPGSLEQCVDLFTGLAALAQSPDDPQWGRQTPEEWTKLTQALEGVGAIPPGKPAADYFTNDFLPQGSGATTAAAPGGGAP